MKLFSGNTRSHLILENLILAGFLALIPKHSLKAEADIEMKRIIVTIILLCAAVFAQSRKNEQDKEVFLEMKQILDVATSGLADKNPRVVFTAESSRGSLSLRHWMVTVQNYPTDYKFMDDRYVSIIFNGPPCPFGKSDGFCSVKDFSGDVLFQGRFDVADTRGHVRRFVGNIMSTASRMSVFRDQLAAHPEWTLDDVAAALTSSGAKFGPNKEREFRETLSSALRTMEKAFGPMRVHKDRFPKPTLWTTPSKEREPIGFQAYWKVVVIPLRAPKDRITMEFDPFEGQLQELIISGLFKRWDSKAKKYKLEYIDPDDK
jgi:hypothetical protein